MRKTISQIRDSLFELIKRPTSSTQQTTPEQSDQQADFYQHFLGTGHSVSCFIKAVERVPRAIFQRSYAVYVVEVNSDMGRYQVKRRYSEFEQFYDRCQRRARISSIFPPRTIFQAGWSEEVTRQRFTQLNNLLVQISASSNIGLQLELFSFLHLYTHYERLGLSNKQSSILATDQSLLQELIRLNQNPVNILSGLRKIHLSLSQRKRRIGFELARQLFIGNEEDEGLLSIVMKSGNELVVSEGMQLLNWLVSVEMNRQSEIFRRILIKCHPSQLVLKTQEMRLHGEVTNQYFTFIRQYLEGQQDEDFQIIAEFYENSHEFYLQYSRWAKFNSMSSA